MPVNPNASIEITAFAWVPPFAEGFVRDLRARWACEEMGLDYAERLIDVTSPRPASYLREQPWGQVPVLKDQGIEWFESGAILLHLGEKDARLLPLDLQGRARAISWLFAALNTIEPRVMEFATINVFAKEETWAIQRRPSLLTFIGVRLDGLADALGEKTFLAGEFSVADIAMATVLKELQDTSLVSSRLRLSAYLDRCLARPAYQRALDAQIEVFRRTSAEGA